MPKALPVQLKELEAKPEKSTEDLARIEELKAKIKAPDEAKAKLADEKKAEADEKKKKADAELLEKKRIADEKKAEADKEAARIKAEKEEKAKFKEGDSDFVDYQRFAAFYHMMWNKDKKAFIRKQLKEQVLVEFDKLEKKFKDYPGQKPKFTKTVFLEAGITNARIVEGYAVPESLYQQFKDAKKQDHYF